MADPVELERRVRAAVAAPLGGSDLGGTVNALRELATLAVDQGNPEAKKVYTELKYDLYYGIKDEDSHALRQWLATTTSDIDDREVKVQKLDRKLSAEELRAALMKRQNELTPMQHPLFRHLQPGVCTLETFKEYLRQKFLIMTTFWRSIAELGFRLSRFPGKNGLALPTPLFKNVYDELGEGEVEQAHLVRHLKHLDHLNLGLDFDSAPEYTETKAYVNFRMRVMRHKEVAWGLGSFFSQEATSLEYTIMHYKMLVHFGISHKKAEIYEAHEEIDTDHVKDIMDLIMVAVQTPEQQAICMAAHEQQIQLWMRHFDVLAQRLGIS